MMMRMVPIQTRGMIVGQLEIVSEVLPRADRDHPGLRIRSSHRREQMRYHLHSMHVQVGGVEVIRIVLAIDPWRRDGRRVRRQTIRERDAQNMPRPRNHQRPRQARVVGARAQPEPGKLTRRISNSQSIRINRRRLRSTTYFRQQPKHHSARNGSTCSKKLSACKSRLMSHVLSPDDAPAI